MLQFLPLVDCEYKYIYNINTISTEETLMKLFKNMLSALLIVIMIMSLSIGAFAYTDVEEDNMYYNYYKMAERLGVILPDSEGNLKPYDYFSRADAIVAAFKMLDGRDETLLEYYTANPVFSDVDNTVAGNIASYVAWANDNMLVNGSEDCTDEFKPGEPITGGEFATILSKVMCIADTSDTSSIEYTNGYTGLIQDVLGDIVDDAPVTREQAAIAFVNAIFYDYDTGNIEVGSTTDYDGNKLNNMAVNVFNIESQDFQIKATKDRTMGFEFTGGTTLLSNGYVFTPNEDFSKNIGYQITITYRDDDKSQTLTQNEKIVNYDLFSVVPIRATAGEYSLAGSDTMQVVYDKRAYSISTSTWMYLNDRYYPMNELYDLVKNPLSNATNRPNLTVFGFLGNNDLTLDFLFFEEKIPGKIVDISNGIYTIKNYYKMGQDNMLEKYDAKDVIVKSGTTNEGDYINFYEVDGKLYIFKGSAIEGVCTNSYMTGNAVEVDGKELQPHSMFVRPDSMPSVGTKAIFIVEGTEGKYYLGWEPYEKVANRPVQVNSIETTVDGKKLNVLDLKDNTTYDINVKTDNMSTVSPIQVGDYLKYYTNGADEAFINSMTSVTVKLGVETDKSFIESGTGNVYYKSRFLERTSDPKNFISGEYTLLLDDANNVLKIS